jgi:hypothetical protein
MMSTRADLKQGLEAFARYFVPFEPNPIDLAVAIDLILDALMPEVASEELKANWPASECSAVLLRQAKRDAWQEGYDRRDTRQPGGTANNPYHENYQGFSSAEVKPVSEAIPAQSWAQLVLVEFEKREQAVRNDIPRWEVWIEAAKILCAKLREAAPKAPESWSEERAALLAECERRREATKKLREEVETLLAVYRRDVEEIHQWRREVAAAVGLSTETGWSDLLARITRGAESLRASVAGATTYQWQEWACTIVGGGINLAPLDLFERTKEEVAILLETSRANERNAREVKQALLALIATKPGVADRVAKAFGKAIMAGKDDA